MCVEKGGEVRRACRRGGKGADRGEQEEAHRMAELRLIQSDKRAAAVSVVTHNS